MTTKAHQPPQPKAKKTMLANILLILGLSIFLAGEAYFGYQLRVLAMNQQQIKEDYSMVNNITFGVFSVDLWQDKISGMVTQKIKGFKVTDEQKKEMQTQIETQLHGMINDVVKEFNKPQKTLGGKLKNFAFKKFVDPKELHDQVPAFAKVIIDKVNSPRTTKKLKDIATSKFEELADQTFDSTHIAINNMHKRLYAKYNVANGEAFNKQAESMLTTIRELTYNFAYAMLGCVLFALLLWLLVKRQVHLHTSLFIMSLLFALVLLVVGVTIPIIEVDARLQSLDILLMGEKLSFHNQVLFFQSNSILGIAEVLIKQPKPDSITVGILMILFVIILPILRMTARGIHLLCRPLLAENQVTRYLAFDSGKWDMADVMVVGILMTYIGLNGILKSQLTDLNLKNEFLITTTVNYSSLLPGYFIFVGYVAFAFILSYILKKVSCSYNR